MLLKQITICECGLNVVKSLEYVWAFVIKTYRTKQEHVQKEDWPVLLILKMPLMNFNV